MPTKKNIKATVLDDKILSQLEKIREEKGLTLSSLIRLIILEWLKQQKSSKEK